MELEIYPTFADFWNLYDKKVGRKELLAKKFLKLPYKDKMKIMENVLVDLGYEYEEKSNQPAKWVKKAKK